MDIFKIFLTIFFVFLNHFILSSEQIIKSLEPNKLERQKSRHDLLRLYKEKLPDSECIDNVLILNDQHEELVHAIQILNFLVCQDEECQMLFEQKVLKLKFLCKSKILLDIAELILIAWHYNEPNNLVKKHLKKSDISILNNMYVNENGALILHINDNRYRLDVKTGKHFICSYGNIICSGEITECLLNKINKVLLKNKKHQTNLQITVTALMAVLFIGYIGYEYMWACY